MIFIKTALFGQKLIQFYHETKHSSSLLKIFNIHTITMSQFTWNIQQAGYNYEQVDEMGEISHADFMEQFHQFPWLEQLDKINALPLGASPTLLVTDLAQNKSLWISMAGDRTLFSYLIGYVYPKEKSIILGLGKRKTRWVEIYELSNLDIIEYCFQLFFQLNYAKLEDTFQQLHFYNQMEEWNPVQK